MQQELSDGHLALELKNIEKSYFLAKEEFPVLKGIDLKIERGDFVSLLGESGGGKSTLMNIIGGLDREYKGEVLVDGILQSSKREKDMDAYRRDTIGFIFQSFNLVSYLTVLDNVLIPLKMVNISEKERVNRALDLLQQVGLYEHRKKKPSQLSGGQKQRVAIARALASDPDIILADEPTGALDSVNTAEVLSILREISDSGKTIIVVTHSQEVADHSSRIIHLEDGKILDDRRLKGIESLQNKASLKSKKLNYFDTFKTAFKHFVNAWKINFLIAMGSAIGLASVMFFLGLGNGVTNYMNKTVNDLANPKVFAVMRRVSEDEEITNNEALMETQQIISSGNEEAELIIDEEQIKKIEEIEHVEKVEPILDIMGNHKIKFEDKSELEFQSLSTWSSQITKSVIAEGKIPKKDELAIPISLAKKINKKEPEKIIGKKVKLTFETNGKNKQLVKVTKEFTISGLIKEENGMTAYLEYNSLNNLLKTIKTNINIQSASIVVDDVKNVEQVIEDVQELKVKDKKIFVTTSLGDMLHQISDITMIVSIVLSVIAGISLLVSIFMIVVTTYMSVAARTKEIGIIRAMGGRKKDISRLFTSESFILGIFSAIVALISAFLGQILTNIALYNLVGGEIIQINSGMVIFAIVIALIIAYFSSLAPASRAARLNTIEALAAE
ncbi:MAG: ATP-binding cassette domain-containing protein [Lactovum sp.]